MKINLDNLKIDFSKVQQDQPGMWPLPLKVLVWIGLLGLVVLGGHNFYLKEKKTNLQNMMAEELKLREDFTKKAFEAKNLDALRVQMEVATKTLDALLKQLPSQTEVPGLLEDITKTGLGSGLEFGKIKLLPERKVQFYTELPINIQVKGSYHDLATFASGVSSLSRIVTLHEFKITPLLNSGGTMLTMDITAKTYRAESIEESAAAASKNDSKDSKTKGEQ